MERVEVEIIAVYYGMSANRRLKILHYVRIVVAHSIALRIIADTSGL